MNSLMHQLLRSLILLTLIQFVPPLPSYAATVSYAGSVVQAENSGFMALGTFKPGFNPHSIYAIYHDPGGNLLGFYSPMVRDGYFRPLSNGLWSGHSFSGTADATAVAGQQLWVVLFDQSNPDASLFSLIGSASAPSWLAPPAAESDSLNCNSATDFVLGSGGNGSALSLQIQPFPEPSGLCSVAVALTAIFWRPRSRRPA